MPASPTSSARPVNSSSDRAPAKAEAHRLIVNGAEVVSTSAALGDLLAELGYGETRVATAVNETFVAASDRAATQLRAGDRIEIVTARQGG